MQATIQDPAREETHANPSYLNLVEMLEQLNVGVRTDEVDAIANELGTTKGEALGLLDMSRSQFSRAGERLSRQASERVLMLKEMARDGINAFDGDAAAFHAWLRRNNLLLGNQSPLKVCSFAIGIREVQKVISRIQTADYIV